MAVQYARRWRSSSVGGAVCLLVAWVSACGWHRAGLPGPSPVEPTLEVAEVSWDFGSVRQGEVVAHAFPIRNTGALPLEIRSIRSTCGCTVALSSAKILDSGERSTVDAWFDTKGLAGARVKEIELETNDPQHPVVTLRIKGTVQADVTATPTEVFLGRIARGRSVSRQVDVKVADPSIAVLDAIAQNGRVLVRREHPDDPQVGARLIITLPPDAEPGRLTDEVLVTTNSASQPQLSIRVLASVEGELSAWPPRPQVGRLTPGLPTEAFQLFAWRDGLRSTPPWHSVDVRSTEPAVVATARTIAVGSRYGVDLRPAEGAAPGPMAATVEVSVDGRPDVVARVPVKGRIAPAAHADARAGKGPR